MMIGKKLLVVFGLSMWASVAAAGETAPVPATWLESVVVVPQGAAHVQVLKERTPGVLIAFPAGNCGAWIGLDKWAAEGARLEEAKPITNDKRGFGVEVALKLPGSSLQIGPVMPGSVQEAMDVMNEGTFKGPVAALSKFEAALQKLPAKNKKTLELAGVTMEKLSLTLTPTIKGGADGDQRLVTVERPEYLGKRVYSLEVRVPGSCQLMAGRNIQVSCGGQTSVTVRIRAFTPYPAALLVDPEKVFTAPEGMKLLDGMAESMPARRLREAREALGVLASPDGVLWASPDLLVFKGSSTLRTLRSVQKYIPVKDLESLLDSVFLNMTNDGRVLSISARGNEVGLFRIIEATSLIEGGQIDKAMELLVDAPVQIPDDTDIETSFFLAPLVRDIVAVEARSNDEKLAFLKGKDGGRILAIADNLEWILRTASAEGHMPYGIATNYIPKWVPEGSWGPYSARMNLVIIPSALTALGDLLEHPLVKEAGLKELDKERFPLLTKCLADGAFLDQLLKEYEGLANKYLVTLPLPHLRSRVARYLGTLDADSWNYFASRKVSDDCIMSDFARGVCYPPEMAEGLKFSASFLDSKGSPIPLMGVWIAERWLDGPQGIDVLEKDLMTLAMPFPLGLGSRLGPVQWNPIHVVSEEAAAQSRALFNFVPLRAEAALNWVHRAVYRQIKADDTGESPCRNVCAALQKMHRNMEVIEDRLKKQNVPATSSLTVRMGKLVPGPSPAGYSLPTPGEIPLSRTLYGPALLDETKK